MSSTIRTIRTTRTTGISHITRLAALALSLGAAGSAFAEDITIDPVVHQSVTTRADVKAQIQDVVVTEADLNQSATLQTGLSRAEVRAETRRALANHELRPLVFDGYDRSVPTTATRVVSQQLAAVQR